MPAKITGYTVFACVSVCLCVCVCVCVCVQVRVVDLYLVEGPKVIYRLALAALKLFTAHTQATGIASTANLLHYS